MKFAALGEVAGADSLRGSEITKFEELLVVRLFVDAVERGLFAVLEFAGHQLVGEQHEFLDELVRDVVLDFFQANGAAVFIQPNFDFRKIQLE